jgi:hypothetical protein
MGERAIVLDGELSLETMAAILPPLEPLWDPFAPLGPVHLDLSGVTFIWPAAITLLTTTVLRLPAPRAHHRRRGGTAASGV